MDPKSPEPYRADSDRSADISADNPQPASRAELVPIGRRPSSVGTALIILTCVLYIPMVIAPLVEIFVRSGDTPPWFLVLASLFNGLVFAALIWIGRWLRRTIGPTIYGPKTSEVLPPESESPPD